jgi:drug/metabolite transporter (DMT)-like permease
VSRAYVFLLIALSAIWGASFMFIKVADRAFHPWTLMAFRVLLAAVILFGVLAAQRGFGRAVRELVELRGALVVMGVLSAALPFTLIAWGETHVDSGVAAIGNGSMPIWVAVLALRFQRQERVYGLRLAGLALGIVGVAVLVGVHPRGGWWGIAGTIAIVIAAISYAAGSLISQHFVRRADPLVVATGSIIGAALVLLPIGLFQLPGHVPGWKPIGSVLALGILGTAAGQLLYFRLLVGYGTARSSLVTYLLPIPALFYGVTLLGEPLTVPEVLGGGLILGGVVLASGFVRLRRREPAAVPSP